MSGIIFLIFYFQTTYHGLEVYDEYFVSVFMISSTIPVIRELLSPLPSIERHRELSDDDF